MGFNIGSILVGTDISLQLANTRWIFGARATANKAFIISDFDQFQIKINNRSQKILLYFRVTMAIYYCTDTPSTTSSDTVYSWVSMVDWASCLLSFVGFYCNISVFCFIDLIRRRWCFFLTFLLLFITTSDCNPFDQDADIISLSNCSWTRR